MQASQAFPRQPAWTHSDKQVVKSLWLRTTFRVMIILLPTLLACLYYGWLATPRYVSEARFVIRAASKPTNLAGGLDSLLQLVGLSHSQDDAYAVHDFLTSRDAVMQLQSQVDLAGIYQQPDVDLLVRYPSALFGLTNEGFFRYLQHRFSVIVNYTTGLTTLRVEAFRAQDAFQVASA